MNYIVYLNEDSFFRVLAEDIKAQDPLPPFPASIKDGYAVISTDGDGLRKVIGFSNAGTIPSDFELKPGSCLRINTGAPVPKGADAVVQVEDTELTEKSPDGKEELEIKINTKPNKGLDIRPIGSDIEKGSVVLNKGSMIGPAEIGMYYTLTSQVAVPRGKQTVTATCKTQLARNICSDWGKLHI